MKVMRKAWPLAGLMALMLPLVAAHPGHLPNTVGDWATIIVAALGPLAPYAIVYVAGLWLKSREWRAFCKWFSEAGLVLAAVFVVQLLSFVLTDNDLFLDEMLPNWYAAGVYFVLLPLAAGLIGFRRAGHRRKKRRRASRKP